VGHPSPSARRVYGAHLEVGRQRGSGRILVVERRREVVGGVELMRGVCGRGRTSTATSRAGLRHGRRGAEGGRGCGRRPLRRARVRTSRCAARAPGAHERSRELTRRGRARLLLVLLLLLLLEVLAETAITHP